MACLGPGTRVGVLLQLVLVSTHLTSYTLVGNSPSLACCREVKKCKAYDSYQLLARTITFREQAGPLLVLVHSHLGEASHPKTRTKVVALLHHAGRGFAANPSAGPQDLMVFVHSVLEPGLAAEEAARQLAQAEATTAVPVARGALLCELSRTWTCIWLSGVVSI